MDKRKVTVRIGGQSCSFYSDDPDEYIAALTEKANAVIHQFSGMNAKAIVFLTDALMRAETPPEEPAEKKTEAKTAEAKSEPKRVRKSTAKTTTDNDQVSVWDLLGPVADMQTTEEDG